MGVAIDSFLESIARVTFWNTATGSDLRESRALFARARLSRGS
jgi:hypothetical protein